MEGLQKKNDLEKISLAKRPEHRQDHLLFDNTEKTTRLGCPRLDAPTLPGSRKLQSHRHTEPYTRIRRCRSQAIHTLQHLGPHAISHGRIGVRAQRLLPQQFIDSSLDASQQVTRDDTGDAKDQQDSMSKAHRCNVLFKGHVQRSLLSCPREQYPANSVRSICSHHPLFA